MNSGLRKLIHVLSPDIKRKNIVHIPYNPRRVYLPTCTPTKIWCIYLYNIYTNYQQPYTPILHPILCLFFRSLILIWGNILLSKKNHYSIAELHINIWECLARFPKTQSLGIHIWYIYLHDWLTLMLNLVPVNIPLPWILWEFQSARFPKKTSRSEPGSINSLYWG